MKCLAWHVCRRVFKSFIFHERAEPPASVCPCVSRLSEQTLCWPLLHPDKVFALPSASVHCGDGWQHLYKQHRSYAPQSLKKWKLTGDWRNVHWSICTRGRTAIDKISFLSCRAGDSHYVFRVVCFLFLVLWHNLIPFREFLHIWCKRSIGWWSKVKVTVSLWSLFLPCEHHILKTPPENPFITAFVPLGNFFIFWPVVCWSQRWTHFRFQWSKVTGTSCESGWKCM